MHYVFTDSNGQVSQISGRADMLKSLGLNEGMRPIVMTDESGAVIGAGFGAEGLIRSGQLVKAMQESQPIVKKPVIFQKQEPLQKSMSDRNKSPFDDLLAELAEMQRSYA